MLKLLVEFGPIIVFFSTYKYSDIFMATMLMLAVTAIGLVVSYIIDRRVSMPLLISGSVLLATGSITIISGDPKFIKMKPTIVNLVFGLILLIGALKGRGLVKYVFAAAIKMPDLCWLTLSRRFAAYFLIMAVTNEMVWRNFSEEYWVNFKIFGFVPLTVLFILTQAPFIYKNQIKTDDKD